MKNNSIDKKEIERLLPHREPMLLIDKLIDIVPLKSATAIVTVKKASFFVQGHFPDQPVMPGVFIVAIRSHGRVWKYKGVAKVNGKKMAEAEWAATVVDRKK